MPPPAPAKHREVQVSVFEPVLKWTTLHRVLKEEEVDFKGVCCSYGNYFCGGGIVLRLYNPLFNVTDLMIAQSATANKKLGFCDVSCRYRPSTTHTHKGVKTYLFIRSWCPEKFNCYKHIGSSWKLQFLFLKMTSQIISWRHVPLKVIRYTSKWNLHWKN